MFKDMFSKPSEYRFNRQSRVMEKFVGLFFGVILLLCVTGAASAATFTVTKIADTNDGVCDADCSLREAIAAAGSVPPENQINFSPAVFNTAQTITLGGNELVLQPGALTINGTGANLLTISGNNASRVFLVAQSATAVINGLTVTGGNGTGQLYGGKGGAIAVADGNTSLTLNDSVVTGSHATSGGGIYNNSRLIINNSVITANTSNSLGGGVYQFTFGTLEMSNSIVSLNLAGGRGGGLAIDPGGSATLTDTVFERNQSTGGGGIYTQAPLNFYLRIRLTGNIASTNGGGIYATDGFGGITTANGVRVNVTDSIISDNRASSGGGGYADMNTGTSAAVRFVLMNSTVSGNLTTFGDGGGFNILHGTLTATNTTFSNNYGAQYGGAIFTFYTSDSIANLTNVTVSHNTAGTAGGGLFIRNLGSPPASTVNLRNTIISDNTATSAPDIAGVINSQGYLLIGNTINTRILGSQVGLLLNVSPRLGPLVNNGGATPTRALLTGSPAIDAGDPNNPTATDQRGITRPKDGNGDGIVAPDLGAFERSINTGTPFDFDGDGKAEIGVFRPSNGTWYSLNITNSNDSAAQLGESSDKIAPADYDGDGKTDYAVFREAAFANFYILQSQSNTVRTEQFGTIGDAPVPGDWDADGKADLAVYRAATATGGQSNFYYRPTSQPTVNYNNLPLGTAGDKPLVGDFDGDGRIDPAVFRPSNASWIILKSSLNQTTTTAFGLSTDIPTPADFDGDGITNIAVFRPSNGTWYTSQSAANNYGAIQFGANGDVPVAADYDGDGKADTAVFRPSNGYWYLNRSTNGFVGIPFGASTDKPIPNAFVP